MKSTGANAQFVSTFPKNNNLEWLRLIFALQVVVSHAGSHFGLEIPGVLSHFPGVPAFFFVSGFLIYASWLNAPGRRYFENRFLRLFPGLTLVTIGGGAIAVFAHGWRDLIEHFNVYALWFVAQITLGQSYNPAHFRDVGVGVMNGSLWTLTTEILFYLSVPVIVWLERRFRFTLIVLVILSFVIYAIGPVIGNEVVYRNKTLYDIVALTPIAWGWMFGLGMLAFKYFDLVRRWLKFLPILVVPMVVVIFFGSGSEMAGPFFDSQGNRLGLVYFVSYIGLVLWFAFATPYLPLTFDLSYGCYIWHMPVINLMLLLAIPSMPVAILLTFAIAILSWFMVEKPALKLKHRSMKPVADQNVREKKGIHTRAPAHPIPIQPK